MIRQRAFLSWLILLGAVSGASAESVWDQPTPPLATPTEIVVHRSESCSCCAKWLAHMKKHGFQVTDVKEDDMDALKDQLRIPESLRSCHTGIVGGYLIEGHVPAGDVKKLLTAKPGLRGLSVPGMPVGTPGMEMGGRKDAFAVIGFDKDGKSSVFTRY